MLPYFIYSTIKDKSTRSKSTGRLELPTPAASDPFFADMSTIGTSRGLDMSRILAPTGGHEKEERRIKSIAFNLNEEGKAVGSPLDTVVFSDRLKRSLTRNKKSPMYQEIQYQNHPWIAKTDAKYLQGRCAGFSPVSSLFHEMSTREREGSEDFGVDSEDSESKFVSVNKVPKNMKLKKQKYNRKSLLYESINQIGMVKGDFAFPRRTYMPKTMIPYVVADDQVPKAIIVERLNRAYRAIDINLVLQTLGVTPSDLIPPAYYGESNEKFYHEKMFRNRSKIEGLEKGEYIHRELQPDRLKVQMFPVNRKTDALPNSEASLKLGFKKGKLNNSDSGSEESINGSKSTKNQSLKTRPPFDPMFPLRVFDDERFDIRSGIEWLTLGWDPEDKKNYAIPGKAYLPFPKPENKKNLPTIATKTNKILLARTEKLEELRKVLMKERYTRMLQNAGISPSKVEASSTKMELAMLAKAVSTISSFTDIQMINLAAAPSRKSIFFKRYSSLGGSTIFQDARSSDSDEDLYTQLEESYVGLQHDILDFQAELAKPCYSPNANEFDPSKSRMYFDGKLELDASEIDLQRSESLLSEVFSQIESLTLLSTEDLIILKNQDDVTENDLTESISELGSGATTPREPSIHRGKSDRSFSRKKSSGAKQERPGLNHAPSSPDVDAYDDPDSAEKFIFDYDKMKKPHDYDWWWVDVAVIDYDLASHKYLVCSTTSKPQIFAWIGKPYLCFDAEDPYIQGERIRDAVLRRYEQEQLMRYNLYIDCLPVKDIPVASDEVVTTIVNKVHLNPKLRLSEKLLNKVCIEQDLMYQRVHAKLRFEKLCEKMPNAFKPWVRNKPVSDFKLDEYNYNTNNDKWEKHKNRCNLSSRGFNYKVRRLQRKMFLSWPETQQTLETIVQCCEDAKKKNFILMNLDDHVHLDEYERIQRDHVSELIQYMKNEWYETILSTIRTQLTRMNNASFNLQEKDYQMYEMSRLPAFLRLINYIMEETVEAMLLNSFEQYTRYIQELTMNCKLRRVYDWGNDLTTSKYTLPKGLKPLFILELKMDNDGPKYTQLLSKYHQTPTRIFAMCIKSVERFPQLFSIVMPNFHGSDKNTLNILSEDDPAVVRLRTQAQNYLKFPLLLLDSYAQKFRRYLSMWKMDSHPHPYISRDDVRMTTTELRRVLDQHRADIERVENEITEELVVSAFVANTGLVKHALIKKKKTACHLMLHNFSERLRDIVIKIMSKYAACERKLSIRSDEIKEVMELRDYAETVPGFIADSMIHINKIVKDYEIFEEYSYTLRDEDVENKWTTAVQSHKMVQIAAQAMDLLEDDYERLLKIQQQDLVGLSDQIDSATMAIAGLNGHADLDKAVEAAADVKKVWQIVKDLESRIELLNERQTVFKQPLTQTSSLKRMLYDIEPYKNLWFTAVECLRVRDSLMKDTLEKIDVTNLTKSVHDGLKVMDHCISYFEDIPPIQHIAMEVKHLTQTYQPILPLVAAFKSPAMKSRHWDEISKICGFPVYPKANEHFKRLIDMGLLEKSDLVIDIAHKAVKEAEIILSIEKMELHIGEYSMRLSTDDSTGIEVQIIQLRDSALDTVIACLHETDLLMESPYKSLYEERLTLWWKKIHAMKENLELWFNLQDTWLNIQPLLPIIRTQTRTPNVLRLYKMAVRVWRRLIRLAKEAELMEEAALNHTVISSLQQFQGLLEKINQGMEEYANRSTPPNKSDSDD